MELVTKKNSKNKNPLDAEQVRRAVVALKQFMEKKQQDQVKKQLVDTPEQISCILTRKNIPTKTSLKPIRIDIPHSFRDDENQVEMCLIVKNDDKKRIKEALEKDPVPQLTKVMTLQKLKKDYHRFEDRRLLLGAFQLFLVDDRVLPYLKTPLGKSFFNSQKQPVAVRVSRKEVSGPIRRAFAQTQLVVSSGVCSNVRIAHSAMETDQIVENILVGMNNCAAHIGKGWMGIQAISIKTNDSVALPVYNSLTDAPKLPLLSVEKPTIKRKLEQVEEELQNEDEQPQKKMKKGADAAKDTSSKKSPAKASKTTPSKTTPSKTTPSKTTPAKTTPAKTTPSKTTPAKTTPAKTTPSKTTPAKTTPAKTTPAKTTPAKTTPAKKSPAKATPAKKSPAKKSTPAKTTPTKKSPAKATPTKKSPAKTTPAKATPSKRRQTEQ